MATLLRRRALGALVLSFAVGCANSGDKCVDDPFLSAAGPNESSVRRANNDLPPNQVAATASQWPRTTPVRPYRRTFAPPRRPGEDGRVRRLARRFGSRIHDDTVGVYGDSLNLALLGTSLGGAIALRHGPDGNVREYVEEHPERWGAGGRAVGRLGEAPVQIPVLLGLYGYSVTQGDDELQGFTESAISAYTITGLSTLAVKGVADTDRPSDEWNGGRWGFPSFHAASGFTLAAVVEEHYGTKAGLPMYALAGVISWTRIDEQDHDLSDVAFGAALGYVVGKSVARRNLEGNSRVRIAPWVHPNERAAGLAYSVTF